TNCATWDSRTISCAPRLISRSLSGKRHEIVSRESSLNSMISMSSPRIKSIKPIREVYFQKSFQEDSNEKSTLDLVPWISPGCYFGRRRGCSNQDSVQGAGKIC